VVFDAGFAGVGVGVEVAEFGGADVAGYYGSG